MSVDPHWAKDLAAACVPVSLSKRFADDPLRNKAVVIPELSRWWKAVCEEINTDGWYHHHHARDRTDE